MEVREDVRQFDVPFVKSYGGGGRRFRRFHTRASDGEVGHAPLQTGFGDDEARVLQCLDARQQERLVVELHAIGGLVLDTIPERLEVRTLQHSLAAFHLLALIGVFDFQTPSQLAENLLHLRQLGGKRLR